MEPHDQPVVAPTEAPPKIPDFDTVLAQLNAHLTKESPDYSEKIAKLKGHSVVAGVAGSIAESMKRIDSEQARLDAASKAASDKEEELLRLAEEDPEEFASRFRTQAQADKALRELEELRTKEEQRIAGQIGLAIRDMPEMQNLTLSEQREIANALAGVSADRVLAAYNAVVLKVASRRQTASLIEAQKPAWLAAEKEAWVAEQNGARLRSGVAPALGIAPRPPASDEPDFRADPTGWLKWNDDQRARRR